MALMLEVVVVGMLTAMMDGHRVIMTKMVDFIMVRMVVLAVEAGILDFAMTDTVL